MGRAASRYSLSEKIRIVHEAYEQPGRLYSVARKYKVDLRNIKKWRKLLDVENVPSNAKMYRPVETIRVEGQDVYDHLNQFFEELRERSVPVSISMLVTESRRFVFHPMKNHTYLTQSWLDFPDSNQILWLGIQWHFGNGFVDLSSAKSWSRDAERILLRIPAIALL
jgi:transposase-like protein